jgi:hypothetical protein
MKDKGMTRADDPKTETPTTAAETLEKESGEQDDKSKDDRREPEEVGGPKGPEPTRYGDWERKGRCIDF